jgi:23S rRNA pseudouridine1911/1915/1917 synthase
VSGGSLSLEVSQGQQGERLDRFLAAHLPEHSRSALRRLIVAGLVAVDGARAGKAGLPLRAGMRVEVRLPPPAHAGLEPEPLPLEVLHEDHDIVVVIKPTGMVVHPGHGRTSGTLVHALLGRGTPLAPAGGELRPGVVHRLDRDTSGVMVLAKTDRAHWALARAFERREVRKTYHALVWGHPDPPQGRIDRPVGRSRSHRTRMTVNTPAGRAALSVYRTIETLPGFALLEVQPVTGRTHQIRVHLKSIHHAIVGDREYGGHGWRGVQDPVQRTALRSLRRLALHATELAFLHPVAAREVRFRAPLPCELDSLLVTLRGKA